MNIKPLKPTRKTDSSEKKKKTEKPKSGIFAEIVTSKLDGVQNISETSDSETENLVELHQQFIATVNHEINNPLFVVRGMAELLKKTDPPDMKPRLIAGADEIADEISAFNHRDIPNVAVQCKNAPLEEIQFRQDLVACYLTKVIAPLTKCIRENLNRMEKLLEIETDSPDSGVVELEKVKKSLNTIRQQAQRIRTIIDKLESLLPENIEISKYIDELKMVNLYEGGRGPGF